MQHPPTARRDPVAREHHGDRFDDPYAWMADRDSDELRELLVAENAHATERTEHLRPLAEQVLLDQNEEGRDHEFFAVGVSEVSPSGDLLAYAVDVVGDERYDVRVRRIEDGVVLDDVVRRTGGSFAWSLDAGHFFYTRVDDAWRPHQVWRHEVGTPAEADVLVHEEADERFFVGVGTSRDDRLVIIAIGSKTTSEFSLLEEEEPMGKTRVVDERR